MLYIKLTGASVSLDSLAIKIIQALPTNQNVSKHSPSLVDIIRFD